MHWNSKFVFFKTFKRRSANVPEFLAEYISTLGLFLSEILSFQQFTSQRTAVITSPGRSAFYFARGLPGNRNMAHQNYPLLTIHWTGLGITRHAFAVRSSHFFTFRNIVRWPTTVCFQIDWYNNDLWKIYFQHAWVGPGAYTAGLSIYKLQ